MTDKRFRAALLRWSVVVGLLVAAFWGVWMQFAPLPPYSAPWEHPRLWWADALIAVTVINMLGWALTSTVPADAPSGFVGGFVGGLVGAVVGGLVGAVVGGLVGAVVGAAAGMAVGIVVGGFVGAVVGGLVVMVAPLRKLFDFLCARNVE